MIFRSFDKDNTADTAINGTSLIIGDRGRDGGEIDSGIVRCRLPCREGLISYYEDSAVLVLMIDRRIHEP